ncbi:MAG: hypothetical protein ACQCN6_08915 [Candidatus Bathyarchaeia archaeon]
MVHTARFCVLIIASLLLAVCLIPSIAAASIIPEANSEYASGTLTQPFSLNVWYAWVNVSGTQVISYAMYVPPDSLYPGPVANIVGQHLQLEDGTDVFVASALTKFEVYQDLNGDGIIQATSGADNELLYYMYTNMSDGFDATSIQKVTENGFSHYKWDISYRNVYGYLGYVSSSSWGGYAAKVVFDHITLSYDFSLNETASNLKTSFDIGKVTSAYAIDKDTLEVTTTPFSLDSLGLALLYTTSTYTSQPYQTSVDGELYNSTAPDASSTHVDLASVTVGNSSAYDFVFGGTYTLDPEGNAQTHQASVETYAAKAEAVALAGLPITLYQPALAQISFFANYLDLNDLFGGSWSNVAIDYSASSFNYRICFPVWDGGQIVHDPVYVGYVSGASQVPELPAALAATVCLLVVTAIAIVVVASRKTN